MLGRQLTHLKMTASIAWTRRGAIVLAAILPFALSHAVVMVARKVGMPERLALDFVHGLIVLSYLTALMRVATGEAEGLARFGFAVPKGVRLPPLGDLLTAAVTIVVIGLPAALVLHPLVQAAEAWQASAAIGVYIPVTMFPEFVMTTLIGLAIAAARSKMANIVRE